MRASTRWRHHAFVLAGAVLLTATIRPIGPAAQPLAFTPGEEPFVGPTASVPFAVRAEPFILNDLPAAMRPYARQAPPPLDEGMLDANDVRVVERDGRRYDHPVAQAQYGLRMLAGYHASEEPAYLERARRQADRLLATAIPSNGALYLPYPFDFPRHDDARDVMRAPWYSAMAQGQALSLFARLAEATGEDRYATAVRLIFNSFRDVRTDADADASGSSPWIAFVDEHGYYWPEEYAGGGRPPDWTFNGLGFALYGLVDYWWYSRDRDARLLAQATLTTINRAAAAVRVPGELSRYCLAHGVQDERYHDIHIGQMSMLQRITGDPRFAEWESLFRADAS